MIAKFMGMKGRIDPTRVRYAIIEDERYIGTFNPLEDWNDWMMVEAKLHERGLWSEYIDYLIAGLVPPEYCEGAINFVMRATRVQRMEAATEVIKGVSDEGS